MKARYPLENFESKNGLEERRTSHTREATAVYGVGTTYLVITWILKVFTFICFVLDLRDLLESRDGDTTD